MCEAHVVSWLIKMLVYKAGVIFKIHALNILNQT